MRVPFFAVTCTLVAVASAIACATSDDGDGAAIDDDAGPTNIPDSATNDVAVPSTPDADADADGAICSSAGFCLTPLPDENLAAADVWPLADRAFVLAKSPFLGVRVLEWSGAEGTWAYVDDGSQHALVESPLDLAPSNIWAPEKDDLYYAVAADGRVFVFHGTRSGTTWTWTHDSFPACAHAELWVSGVSREDVFVGGCETIYRRSTADAGEAAEDAGAPSGWVVDHVESDPTNDVSFLGLSGTGGGDIWFAGGRHAGALACGIALRKTAAGYERIVDSELDRPSFKCLPKDGMVSIGGDLAFVRATANDRFVALSNSATPVRLMPAGDGGFVSQLGKRSGLSASFTSAWIASEDELWLAPKISTGQVLRATDVWTDAGAYDFSSIALNGAPILSTIERVRGTSNTNLWAVGGKHVLHKTTP